MPKTDTAANLMKSAQRSQTIMFFDGNCPLCSREVRHYKRLDRNRRIDWIDINQHMGLLDAFGVSHETAMRRLHVLTYDGRLVSGAHAFAAVWLELPYYYWLAKALYTIRAMRLLDVGYERFAQWRYRRRCQAGTCILSTNTDT